MNPYEMQHRMVKAVKIVDMAERLGFSPDELAKEKNMKSWAKACEIKQPSKETWQMAVSLLKNRREYNGEGGLDDPRFIQSLGSMAVQIANTLAQENLDSSEAEQLTKGEKRKIERMSEATTDTFDLGKKFLEDREDHRWESMNN